MTTNPAVYLAGPDVFRPDATEVGLAKKEICERHGLRGHFPLDDLDLPDDLGERTPERMAQGLFEACAALMDDCDAIVANLTPFRGVSADVGTVFEIGYMLGQGKPVWGYTSETAAYHERVEPDGLMVEPFGMGDNLMVDGAVMRTGGPPVRRAATDGDHLAALEAFERCIERAAGILVPGRG